MNWIKNPTVWLNLSIIFLLLGAYSIVFNGFTNSHHDIIAGRWTVLLIFIDSTCFYIYQRLDRKKKNPDKSGGQ